MGHLRANTLEGVRQWTAEQLPPRIAKDIPVDPRLRASWERNNVRAERPSCKFTTNVNYAKKELANRLGVDPNDIGERNPQDKEGLWRRGR